MPRHGEITGSVGLWVAADTAEAWFQAFDAGMAIAAGQGLMHARDIIRELSNAEARGWGRWTERPAPPAVVLPDPALVLHAVRVLQLTQGQLRMEGCDDAVLHEALTLLHDASHVAGMASGKGDLVQAIEARAWAAVAKKAGRRVGP